MACRHKPENRWPQREPIVKELAGKIPAQEIAKRIGVSYGRLRELCALHGISLRVDGLRSERMRQRHERLRKLKEASPSIDHLWKPTKIVRITVEAIK